MATASVASLGPYERDAATSESDRKRFDEQINSAADTLCRASGVLKYLSETIIPQWEESSPDMKNRPPDVTREVTSALSKICLADAEKLAIRRLLSKSVAVAEAVIRPGPPLPRGHPSPSLLAKLYLNVYALYDSARSLGKSVGNKNNVMMSHLKRDRNGTREEGDASDTISQDLRTYLSDGRAFSSSLGYKWLGVDAGENANKTGEAIAWLSLAKTGLLQLQGKSKSLLSMRKGKVERSKRKDRLSEELDDIEAFYKSYKRTNDTVLFQPVPSEPALLAQMPAGRSALAVKLFALPPSAFPSRRQVDLHPVDATLAAHTASMFVGDEDSDSDASEVDEPVGQSNYF